MGSSKNMTGGLLSSSCPMDSLFLSPPDNLPTRVSADFVRPSSSKISLICYSRTSDRLTAGTSRTVRMYDEKIGIIKI